MNMEMDLGPEIIKLNRRVSEGKGIAYVPFSEFPNIKKILSIKRNYKCFFRASNGCVVCTTPQRKNLYLYVPKDIKGLLIGSGGHRIKQISKLLNVYHIEVITEK